MNDSNNTFKLNIKKSPVDERDFIAETIYSTEGELPEEHDMREDLRPIRNQGSQGTCAAQTSACMKEWQEKHDVAFNEYMSPQFIYNNRANQDSEGMYSRDVMKILNKIGSVREKDYPYNSFDPISDELRELAGKYKIAGYASVNSVEGVKKALVKNGPCYFACPVYNRTQRMWKPRQGDKKIGGHAMTIVGYNDVGLIIRNSWGTSWGDEGYTIFPYEDWGLHWEIWTTIDAESGEPIVPPKPKKKSVPWYIKLWRWLFG